MKRLSLVLLLCLVGLAVLVGPAIGAAQKVSLVPCPINYPGGREGSAFVILNNSKGPNNLQMTVHLQGAPPSPSTYSVWLFVDGPWYGGGPVGEMTINEKGNANFHINVSVTPDMGHWLAVDLTAKGSTADIYETPGIHTPGHRSIYMEF